MENNSRKKNAFFIISLVMAMMLIMPLCAFASEGSIDVSDIHIQGDHKVKNKSDLKTGRHTFVLTAIGESPMPEGAEEGDAAVKKVTISSNETFDFGTIEYAKPGQYAYRLERELSKSKNLIEDDSKYTIFICVYNDGTATIVYQKDGEAGKPDKIEYIDEYKANKKGGGGAKTSDDSNLYMSFIFFGSAVVVLVALVRRRYSENK